MEMQLHPHYWVRRAPNWGPAVVAGLAAGAILMVLELCWSATLGDGSPWIVSRKVAALVMGQEALQSTAFSLGVITVALVTHYALGIFSGVAIGTLIAGFHWETSLGMMQIIGAAFGLVIYAVNFYALAPLFPWFADLRGWSALIGHVVFGISAALIYWKLSLRGTPT